MSTEKRLIDGNGRYTLHASDNTDYSLLFRNGIICVENELGHCVCEFHADDAPTVDAENVVRCKDCKHRKEEFCFHENWRKDDGFTAVCENDFCSYGERKEERT